MLVACSPRSATSDAAAWRSAARVCSCFAARFGLLAGAFVFVPLTYRIVSGYSRVYGFPRPPARRGTRGGDGRRVPLAVDAQPDLLALGRVPNRQGRPPVDDGRGG